MRVLFTILLILSCSLSRATTYYVATTGNNAAAGTISAPWATLEHAFTSTSVQPGDTVFIRGGVYYVITNGNGVSAERSGTSDNWIVYTNYQDEKPIFDFGNMVIGDIEYPGLRHIGIVFSGVNYVKFRGVTVRNVKQYYDRNIARAIYMRDGIVTLENCTAYNNWGSGIISNHATETGGIHRIINCDSYNNCDSISGVPAGSNAGNAASGIVSQADYDGGETYIIGCRAWGNADQQFMINSNAYIRVESSYGLAGRAYVNGGGGGFKMGWQVIESDELRREIINCVAAFNDSYGFFTNENGSGSSIGANRSNHYNNIAYHNGFGYPSVGFGFLIQNTGESVAIQERRNFSNNVSYGNYVNVYNLGGSLYYSGSNNSWDTGVTVSNADFISVDSTGMTAARQADGSLPDNDFYNNFLKLASTSDLIDAGIDVGLAYNGIAPDIGAFEYDAGSQIIADHSIVDDYDDIPQQWIDSVKKMWVSYAGESHAAGVRVGMNLLEALDPTYAVYTQESGTPAAYTDANLRFNTATWGDFSNATGWRHGYGEEDWWTNSTALARTKAGLDYCNTTGPSLSAFGFGWCYDDSHTGSVSATADPVYGTRWYGRSLESPSGSRNWGLDDEDNAITGNTVNLDTYLAATQEYINHCITNGYNTKVFFSTGPVEPTYYEGEAGYQASLKHQRIRDYVLADPTRILFDYADILCYDDGSEVMNTDTWNDHEFPFITDTNYGDASIGHISEEGVVRVAKAMWWMLARMAGWDGLTDSEPELSTATNIIAFSLPQQTGAATINTTNHTVAIEVAYGTSLTSLSPSITVSYGASIDPPGGTARNFTSPVTYTVTAEDGVTEQEWTVTVTQEEEPTPSSSNPPVHNGRWIVHEGVWVRL